MFSFPLPFGGSGNKLWTKQWHIITFYVRYVTFLLIYTFKQWERNVLQYIRRHVFGHLMNLKPIFCFCFSSPLSITEGIIWRVIAGTFKVHVCVCVYVFPLLFKLCETFLLTSDWCRELLGLQTLTSVDAAPAPGCSNSAPVSSLSPHVQRREECRTLLPPPCVSIYYEYNDELTALLINAWQWQKSNKKMSWGSGR